MKARARIRVAVVLGGTLPLLGTTVFKSVAAVFWLAGLISLVYALVLAMRLRNDSSS